MSEPYKIRFWCKALIEFDIRTKETKLIRSFGHPDKDQVWSKDSKAKAEKPKQEQSESGKQIKL